MSMNVKWLLPFFLVCLIFLTVAALIQITDLQSQINRVNDRLIEMAEIEKTLGEGQSKLAEASLSNSKATEAIVETIKVMMRP